MKLDESTSLRERLLGWIGRHDRHADVAAPDTMTTTRSSQAPSSRKSHSPNQTTFLSTLNEWVSESRPNSLGPGETRPGLEAYGAQNGRGFLERWLGQDPVRKKQEGIGKTRTELRQVDMSIQELNRRIEHLERIAEKWQTHKPDRKDDAGSQLNRQV